jgi:hypothetical protein
LKTPPTEVYWVQTQTAPHEDKRYYNKKYNRFYFSIPHVIQYIESWPEREFRVYQVYKVVGGVVKWQELDVSQLLQTHT